MTSSRRSGTSVAWSGLTSQAMARTCRVAGHFQVELHGDRFAEDPQVAVLDVAAVFAEVQGDAVGPAQLRQGGRPDGVGLVGPPRLPHGGHVIDVDAQFRHGSGNLRGMLAKWASARHG